MILRKLFARIFRRQSHELAIDGELLRRGFRLQSAGDVAGAEADYRNALAVVPANADAGFLLGSLLGETGRLTEAQQYLRQALATRPRFVDAPSAVGNVFLLGGNSDAPKAWYCWAIIF